MIEVMNGCRVYTHDNAGGGYLYTDREYSRIYHYNEIDAMTDDEKDQLGIKYLIDISHIIKQLNENKQ